MTAVDPAAPPVEELVAPSPTGIVQTIRAGTDVQQGLKPRSELTARELLREVGAVLRMS